MITTRRTLSNGRVLEFKHPIKVRDCEPCGIQWWIHDKRLPEVLECPTCGGALKRGTYDIATRHEFLDIGKRKCICRTCGGRSQRKVLERNHGNCIKCGPYIKRGPASPLGGRNPS